MLDEKKTVLYLLMYAIQVCRLKYENGKTKRNHTGVQRVRVPPFLQNTKTIKQKTTYEKHNTKCA
jgi:hypothetical protein